MKLIEKRLKYGTFIYNTEKDNFWVGVVNQDEKNVQEVILNKVYAFALSRFITRVSQRNWYRRKVKTHEELK